MRFEEGMNMDQWEEGKTQKKTAKEPTEEKSSEEGRADDYEKLDSAVRYCYWA